MRYIYFVDIKFLLYVIHLGSMVYLMIGKLLLLFFFYIWNQSFLT